MLWICIKPSLSSFFSLNRHILHSQKLNKYIFRLWYDPFKQAAVKLPLFMQPAYVHLQVPSSIQYIWKCNLLYVKWKMQFSNAWQQVLVKWSDTICYLVSYSHLQHDKLHFSRALRSKGSWHAFIDLHRLYACIPVCRQIVPRVNSSHCASVSRKLQSSQGSQDGVRLGKRDTCSPLES